MDLWKHFLGSLILIACLYPFFGKISFLVLLGGFFIDLDHILFYWLKFKKIEINPNKINAFYKAIKTDQQYRAVIRPFHNLESLVIISLISPFVGIGVLLHFCMDIFEEKQRFGHIRNYLLIPALINLSSKKR